MERFLGVYAYSSCFENKFVSELAQAVMVFSFSISHTRRAAALQLDISTPEDFTRLQMNVCSSSRGLGDDTFAGRTEERLEFTRSSNVVGLDVSVHHVVKVEAKLLDLVENKKGFFRRFQRGFSHPHEYFRLCNLIN